ncbi:MAG: 3(2),5-bisphosphate nucleotidase CysQ, partial [Pseudomonadota bacterium]
MIATLSLLAAVEAVAEEAALRVLEVYATDFAVLGKADASPVTLADERAEACIVAALKRLTPEVPVVAEEAVS